jgi:hypothetical protein
MSAAIIIWFLHRAINKLRQPRGNRLMSFTNRATRERCYDFLNIFAEKFNEKIGVFYSKQSYVNYKNIDHNIGFWEKTPISLQKIVENRRKLWS